MAARADAAHAAIASGRPVMPQPVTEPPRRGWIAGIVVAAILAVCLTLAGLTEPAPTVSPSANEASDPTADSTATTNATITTTTASQSPPPTSEAVRVSESSSSATASAPLAAPTAIVTRVVDGDTIHILDDVTGEKAVRILGIDSPETKRPGYTVGCWGPESAAWASQQLAGARVAVITDPTQDPVDAYDRVLAYVVRADGWDYSVEAARAGTATSYVYDEPTQRQPAIDAAQAEAKATARGLWGPPCNGVTEAQPETTSPPAPAVPHDDPPVPIPPPVPVPAPAPAPAPAPEPAPGPSAYYPNCKAARAAGVAPLYVGEPGYRSGLDGDDDGVACE